VGSGIDIAAASGLVGLRYAVTSFGPRVVGQDNHKVVGCGKASWRDEKRRRVVGFGMSSSIAVMLFAWGIHCVGLRLRRRAAADRRGFAV
jgi:hypothetical protein